MKKYLYLLLLPCLLLSVVGTAQAQEKGLAWGAAGSTSNTSKDFRALSLEAYMGYNFSARFSTFLKADSQLAAIEKDQLKKAYSNQALGLMLKYQLYPFRSGILDLRGGAGRSILGKDWEYWYWDCGLFLQASRAATKPTIGLGFKQYKSLTKGEKDASTLFVSVGFTVN